MLFAIFVAFCNFISLKFYLYWTNSWVDIPMHIFGGALVSSIGLWIFYFSPWKNLFIRTPKQILILSVLVGFSIGFLWEIFELMAGMTSLSVDKIDTVKDLIDDIIGALIIGWYFVRNIKKYDRN